MSRGSADEEVFSAVRDMLTTGELKPGEPVRQAEIAARLGVSRVPVREALQTLEAVGLLEHTPNRGYSVTRLTFREVDEIYRLRTVLETDATRQTLNEGGLARRIWHMTEAHRLEREADPRDIVLNTRLNRDFHFPLFESATRAQRRLISQLWDLTDPYRILFYREGGVLDRSFREHAALIELVEKRDVDAVITAADEHRNRGLTELARLMD